MCIRDWVQLLLAWGGAATTWLLIGFVPLGMWAVWWLVDAFLLPGMVRRRNEADARRVLAPQHPTF